MTIRPARESDLPELLAIYNYEVCRDFDEFKRRSDVILANRMSAELNDVSDKVYTRDLYSRD